MSSARQIFILSVLITFTSISWASDHIDGPITTEYGAADLTDLFVFPTPSRVGFLTLVMNAHPMLPPTGHFEERLRYIFRIRQASLFSDGVYTLVQSEHTISCSFKSPHDKDQNKMICSSNKGLKIEGQLNRINQNETLKVWAGMRSDPFFFDAKWAIAASKEGKLIPGSSKNTMDKLNVLSIVLEIDVSKLFPENPHHSLYAVLAEIRVKNLATKLTQLLDRVGRPEITNVSMVNHEGREDLRDQYNIEETFSLPPDRKKKYIERLIENISYYDNLDGSVDWTERKKMAVASLLVEDFILIDMGSDCSAKNFLSIEKSVLNGTQRTGCGGRFLNEDIMDELFSFYVNGGKSIISDGVGRPYRDLSPRFPYLAEPDTSILARIKAWLARWKVGQK